MYSLAIFWLNLDIITSTVDPSFTYGYFSHKEEEDNLEMY